MKSFDWLMSKKGIKLMMMHALSRNEKIAGWLRELASWK